MSRSSPLLTNGLRTKSHNVYDNPPFAMVPANRVRRRFCVVHGLVESTGRSPRIRAVSAKPAPIPSDRGSNCMARRLSEEERRDQEALQRLEWIRHIHLIKESENPDYDVELKTAVEINESELLLGYRKRIDRSKETIFRSLNGTRMIGVGIYQMAADTSITWRLEELAHRMGPNAEQYKGMQVPGFGGLTFGDLVAYKYDRELKDAQIQYLHYRGEDGRQIQHGFPSYQEQDPAWAERLNKLQKFAESKSDHKVPRSASAYKSGLEDLQPPKDAKDFYRPQARSPRPLEKLTESTRDTHNPRRKQETTALAPAQRTLPTIKVKRPAILRRKSSSDKDVKTRRIRLRPVHRKPSQVLEYCEEGDCDHAIVDSEDGDNEDTAASTQVSAPLCPSREDTLVKTVDKTVRGLPKGSSIGTEGSMIDYDTEDEGRSITEEETALPSPRNGGIVNKTVEKVDMDSPVMQSMTAVSVGYGCGSLLHPKTEIPKNSLSYLSRNQPKRQMRNLHEGPLLGMVQDKGVEVYRVQSENTERSSEATDEPLAEGPHEPSRRGSPRAQDLDFNVLTRKESKNRDTRHITFELRCPPIRSRMSRVTFDSTIHHTEWSDAGYERRRTRAKTLDLIQTAAPRPIGTVTKPEDQDVAIKLPRITLVDEQAIQAFTPPILIPSASRQSTVQPPSTPPRRRSPPISLVQISPTGLVLARSRSEPCMSAYRRSVSAVFTFQNISEGMLKAHLRV